MQTVSSIGEHMIQQQFQNIVAHALSSAVTLGSNKKKPKLFNTLPGFWPEFDQIWAIYTVFDQAESEVKKHQILDPGGKIRKFEFQNKIQKSNVFNWNATRIPPHPAAYASS